MDGNAILARLPRTIAARIRSMKQADGRLTAVVDAAGLDASARAALEAEITAALTAVAEGRAVHVALMADRPAPTAPPPIVAVGSGKGGVGKSTLTANLAVALARSGLSVGLIDADIYGPSQPTLLGTEGAKPEATGKLLHPVASRWGVRMLSMGHLVEPGRALAWRGPMASGALSQLVDADWAGADVLLMDLPPGTGDVQITMLQKHKPIGAVIVSTPQDLALIDAQRAADLFAQGGVPVIGLVENMAGYTCPHCGEVSDPFGSGGAEKAAGIAGIPFLGRVPLSLTVRTASDAGTPPAAGDGEDAQPFIAIASAVARWLRDRGA